MTDSLSAATPSHPAPGRRRPGRRARVVAAAALALAATLGLAACGSSDHNASGGDQHQGQGGRHGDGQGGPGGRGVGGKITTEGAGSWQITKQDGSTETVAISATTEFGSKAKSETAAQFAVGDQIMVQGQETDGTIAATRIMHARDHTAPNGTPPSSPAGTPPASPSSTPPTK
ncbi:DUF5666 domain-containing protein [Nocardia tengchongensis]|uniref:DUF5666 domain-containing protein n=1 Tax=Nocardia tengchongensis TaxID=2055889 RepID=UPI0036AFF6D4